jgi:hypothetical protein
VLFHKKLSYSQLINSRVHFGNSVFFDTLRTKFHPNKFEIEKPKEKDFLTRKKKKTKQRVLKA